MRGKCYTYYWMYTKLTERRVQVTWSVKSQRFFLSSDNRKTFIKGRHTTIPVKFGKYFRWVKTTPQKILNNSIFTLPTESSKKKYGSEALLGHATRYHGDVNLNYTMLTKIME